MQVPERCLSCDDASARPFGSGQIQIALTRMLAADTTARSPSRQRRLFMAAIGSDAKGPAIGGDGFYFSTRPEAVLRRRAR